MTWIGFDRTEIYACSRRINQKYEFLPEVSQRAKSMTAPENLTRNMSFSQKYPRSRMRNFFYELNWVWVESSRIESDKSPEWWNQKHPMSLGDESNADTHKKKGSFRVSKLKPNRMEWAKRRRGYLILNVFLKMSMILVSCRCTWWVV